VVALLPGSRRSDSTGGASAGGGDLATRAAVKFVIPAVARCERIERVPDAGMIEQVQLVLGQSHTVLAA
jgi:hypothetical protein